MARKTTPTLTDAELRIMDVLWEHGRATVAGVMESLPADLAYNTVLTTLRIMEKKGYVRHRKDGRAFVYAPTVRRQDAQTRATAHLLDRFFGSSPERLVLSLVKDEKIDAATLERLRRMIEEES